MNFKIAVPSNKSKRRSIQTLVQQFYQWTQKQIQRCAPCLLRIPRHKPNSIMNLSHIFQNPDLYKQIADYLPTTPAFFFLGNIDRDSQIRYREYAQENGIEPTHTCDEAIFESPARLQLYIQEEVPRELGSDALLKLAKRAIACGSIPSLRYLSQLDCFYWGTQLCSTAALNGRLSVLKWLRANGCDWDWETCAWAAESGHLEVLQWARANGCEWTAWTCAYAAENGHLDVLQWARANGCDWDLKTCTYAAENGHLEVLQWARANGCNWDTETCKGAAENGHLDVLQWARAKRCYWDSGTCAAAAKNGHLEVLQWARENGCNWDWRTCANAAQNGHLEVLQWARDNGCSAEE